MQKAFASTALPALVALPWLWPLTAGPVAAVLPYLVAAVTAAALLALWPRDAAHGMRVAALGWLLAAVCSAAVALVQYFDAELPLFPFINIAKPGQAFGNLRQPNQLATLLVMGLLALRWLWQQPRWPGGGGGDGERQAWRLWPAWGMAAAGALLLAALAATASRVGLLELLAACAAALWWARGQGRAQLAQVALAACAALAVYALAALALPALLQLSEGVSGRSMVERLQNAESTCGSRLILWSNVLHLIAQAPWAGWGWGELSYAHYATLYPGARFCHILDNAHNLPLHLAVSLGVPAAALACGLLLWGVWRGRPWAARDADSQLAWGVLAVLALHSLVEYPLWYGPFQIAALICLWRLWRLWRLWAAQADHATAASPPPAAPASASAPASAPPARWRAPLAACMLAAVAYAGWDYHRISQLYLTPGQRAAAYRDDALAHARRSWLFAGEARFAEVTVTPPTPENAPWLLPLALRSLHFSPEPRVITRVIESAAHLGQRELAQHHLARFEAAFADERRRWAQGPARALAQDIGTPP